MRKTLALSMLLLVVIALGIHVSTAASVSVQDADHGMGFWYRMAVRAVKASRHAIRRAAYIIRERAGGGVDVSTSVKLLRASVRIHKVAVAFLVNGNPRRSLLSASLSILVARDSVRVASENPEGAVSSIPSQVKSKIEEVRDLLNRLEDEGVDVTLPRRILNLAERLNGRGGNLIAEGRVVQGVVAAEMGRMLAWLSQVIASRST